MGNMNITKAVIPLAGLGTRFLPITKSIPKEILPFGKYPVVHWVIKELAGAGITQFLLITSDRNRVFEDYFTDDVWLREELKRRNKQNLIADVDRLLETCTISFMRQRDAAGIGQAMLQAKDWVGNNHFFCHMGDNFFLDSWLCTRMVQLHIEHSAAVTISAKRLEKDDIQSRAHLVREKTLLDGVFSFRKYIEKPQVCEITEPYGVIGRYVLSPDIFEILESLAIQESLLEDRDFGKSFNLLLKRGLGLGVESYPGRTIYDAGTRDIYYASLIEFLALQDRAIRNVVSRIASKEIDALE